MVRYSTHWPRTDIMMEFDFVLMGGNSDVDEKTRDVPLTPDSSWSEKPEIHEPESIRITGIHTEPVVEGKEPSRIANPNYPEKVTRIEGKVAAVLFEPQYHGFISLLIEDSIPPMGMNPVKIQLNGASEAWVNGQRCSLHDILFRFATAASSYHNDPPRVVLTGQWGSSTYEVCQKVELYFE